MKLWLQNLAWQLGVALGLIEPRACNPSRWKTTSNAGASPRGNVAEPVPDALASACGAGQSPGFGLSIVVPEPGDDHFPQTLPGKAREMPAMHGAHR